MPSPTARFPFLLIVALTAFAAGVARPPRAEAQTASSRRVWYVDNAGANGDGSAAAPFATLDAAASASAAGDVIAVRRGKGPYAGGMALKDQQYLIGEGIDPHSILDPLGVTLGAFTPGAAPIIADADNDAIRLARMRMPRLPATRLAARRRSSASTSPCPAAAAVSRS